MDKKRSLGVTIFGVLLLLGAAIGTFNFAKMLIESYEVLVIVLIFNFIQMIALRLILGVGILRLDRWARSICLWISWLVGIAFIALGVIFGIVLWTEIEPLINLTIIPYVLAVCVLVIFFLTRPKIKEQFK